VAFCRKVQTSALLRLYLGLGGRDFGESDVTRLLVNTSEKMREYLEGFPDETEVQVGRNCPAAKTVGELRKATWTGTLVLILHNEPDQRFSSVGLERS
jgi:hypothetical protein